MTHAHLALDSASFILPDGRVLLSGLTEQFDTRHTGLVGRNGVGKGVLARLLAGQLPPSSGARVREAARDLHEDSTVRLHGSAVDAAAQRRVLELAAVELPFAAPALRPIDLVVTGRRRIGITGPNGSGKSTLMKVIAGELAPLGGQIVRDPACAWLDQRLASLDPARSTLAQLLALNRSTGQDRLRTYMEQIGLDAHQVAQPAGQLSGGERLKAALSCALYADPPARWWWSRTTRSSWDALD